MGNNLNVWGGLVDEEGGVDFLLEDGSGRALVKVGHAKAVLDFESGESGFLSEPSSELEPFLRARGHSMRGFLSFSERPIRYREWVVESGDLVAVVGAGRWERDPSARVQAGDGYREAVLPRRLVLATPPGGPLLLAEEPDVTT